MLTLVESRSARAPHESVKPADALAEPAHDSAQRTLAAGDVLFREGEPRTHVFRIETGAVCLYKSRADGTKEILEFAFPGDIVGLGLHDSHTSGAQATVETSLSCLPRSAFDPAVGRDAPSGGHLTAPSGQEAGPPEDVVRKRQPMPAQRIASLFVTLSRYNAYEGRNPNIITDSLKCGVVAGYLDMSVDQLAMHLSDLEARGLIEPCDKGLHLKDIGALESLADSVA